MSKFPREHAPMVPYTPGFVRVPAEHYAEVVEMEKTSNLRYGGVTERVFCKGEEFYIDPSDVRELESRA